MEGFTNICPLLSTIAPINEPKNNFMPCIESSCTFWDEENQACLIKEHLSSNANA